MAEESESNEDQVAEEMMRMMEEEADGEEGDDSVEATTVEGGVEATDEAEGDESGFDEEGNSESTRQRRTSRSRP